MADPRPATWPCPAGLPGFHYDGDRAIVDVAEALAKARADGYQAALNDLAKAGRLLPEPTEVETRWNVRFLNGSGQPVIDWELANPDRAGAEDAVRYFGDHDSSLVRCEVRDYPDGSRWVGPWVPVDPDTKEDT